MKLDFIQKIVNWYREFIEDATYTFTAEAYELSHGKSDRFPSLVSAVLRFILKYLYIVVGVIWIISLVMCLFTEEIPTIGAFIVSPLATVLLCLAALIVFFVLMMLESFSKILASLVLYNELPEGAENPVDSMLLLVINRKI